jgi:hypothetical protein
LASFPQSENDSGTGLRPGRLVGQAVPPANPGEARTYADHHESI